MLKVLYLLISNFTQNHLYETKEIMLIIIMTLKNLYFCLSYKHIKTNNNNTHGFSQFEHSKMTQILYIKGNMSGCLQKLSKFPEATWHSGFACRTRNSLAQIGTSGNPGYEASTFGKYFNVTIFITRIILYLSHNLSQVCIPFRSGSSI